MKTMGQAVDEAILEHKRRYPHSEVYHATVEDFLTLRVNMWRVSVCADHFSTSLIYDILKD